MLTPEDTFYTKHILEGPLRLMDCGHQRIFYREVGEAFRCSQCGHVNGSKVEVEPPEDEDSLLDYFFFKCALVIIGLALGMFLAGTWPWWK